MSNIQGLNRSWSFLNEKRVIKERELDFIKKIIKDRNGMDLTEAEDTKKRWQEYTEELYKKLLMTQIATMVWSLT